MKLMMTLTALAVGMTAQHATAQVTAGPTIEANVGYDATTSHDNYEDLPDTLSGARIGIAAGYDVAVNRSITLGAEASIGAVVADETHVRLALDRLTLKMGRDLDVLARVRFQVGDKTALRLKAGYANSRLVADYESATPAGIVARTRFLTNAGGLRLGAGIEHRLTKKLFVTADYRWTRYSSDPAYQKDPTRSQILLGTGIRF